MFKSIIVAPVRLFAAKPAFVSTIPDEATAIFKLGHEGSKQGRHPYFGDMLRLALLRRASIASVVGKVRGALSCVRNGLQMNAMKIL
jgi:hypothetical protein